MADLTDRSDVFAAAAPIDLTGDDLVDLAQALYLPRLIEEKMLRLLRQGRLSKWFSGVGQEAIAVGLTWALRPDDWILPLHRNLGVFTTRGLDLDRLLRQLFGKADGYTGGRDRTFHFGTLNHHVVGMISHLGAMLPVADGLALAARLRGEDRVVAVFSGDGGTSEGDFHEALNLAAVWRLPVLFVVENNGWGLSTPTREQYACADLADRAAGYGMPGVVADGNDVLAVVGAVQEAAARARAGGGPTLLEFKTYRMRGHEEASGTDYVPSAELAEWATRDPLLRLEAVLDARGVFPAAERAALKADLAADLDRRVEASLAAPDPSSTSTAELAAVFAPPLHVAPSGGEDRGERSESFAGLALRQPSVESPPADQERESLRPKGAPGAAGEVRELRYLDAITEALREAMRADPSVILLGQDIAEYGGAFKATEGLVAEFGKERVRNTPIMESGAIGCALGLALDGFRPVVEMQFGDFIACGYNQIVNNLATTYYRWGAAVPVVIRAPIGGGLGAGPFHSQNVEACFANVPGLKIVAPATPADAKGLLLAALDDGNPVLVLEHKLLYRAAKGPVPAGRSTVPLGQARIARRAGGGTAAGAPEARPSGADAGTRPHRRTATVVTYGAGVAWALEAANALAIDGTGDVEVVDLRSLRPWDKPTVMESVARTGRALVLHEAPVTGGFGAEVAATIAEEAFANLDAPVARLGALDTPVPFSRLLEAVHSPKDRLLPTLRRLLAY